MGKEAYTSEHADTSETLKREAPRILAIWEARIRREIGAAEFQGSPALRNEIQDILTSLADELSQIERSVQRKESDRERSKGSAERHGASRAALGHYILADVILEYHVLRETLFSVLEETRELARHERDIIISTIERAVNDTASQFTKSIKEYHQLLLLTIVHDLRGPANNIRLGAQLLARSVDPGCKDSAAIIAQNAERISKMAGDLLDASKVEAGGVLRFDFSEVDLVELAESAAKGFEGSRIRIVRSSGAPIRGNWNRDALIRVLENLIGNAVKFGEPGTPVTVRLEDTKNQAVIAVHNEGRPIPHADRALLFKRFSRGGATQSGWGIGLLLVKGVVDAHGGTIELESEEGEGTTFTIRFPKIARRSF